MTARLLIHVLTSCLSAVLVAGPARPVAASPGATISFNGTDYVHRWSKDGQNEYTPQGEEDLSAWTSMVTIVVHDWARSGDQLAELANRVLGNYQATGGKILRTASKPRTKDQEAEHFVAAVLGNPKYLEAVFSRMLLVDRRAVAIVYSRRIYGSAVGGQMSAWLGKNGEPVERALMSWSGLPTLAALEALPQGRPAGPPAAAPAPGARKQPRVPSRGTGDGRSAVAGDGREYPTLSAAQGRA